MGGDINFNPKSDHTDDGVIGDRIDENKIKMKLRESLNPVGLGYGCLHASKHEFV